MDTKTSDSAEFDLDDGWETPTPPGSEQPSAEPQGRHAPLVQTDASAARRVDTTAVEAASEAQPTTDDLDEGWDLDPPPAPRTPPPAQLSSGTRPASSTSRADSPEALRSTAAQRKTKSGNASPKKKSDTSAPLPTALTGRRAKTRTKARVHRKSQERAAKTKHQRQARAAQRKELREERRRQRREAAQAANRSANPRRPSTVSRSERRPSTGPSERDSAPGPRAHAVDAPVPSRRKPRVVVRKRQRTGPSSPANARRDDRAEEARTVGRSVSAFDPRTNRGIAVLLLVAVAVGVLIWLVRGG